MAIYTNTSKNSGSFTNQNKSASTNLTWNEATFSWDDANGTWDAPQASYNKQTKNTATFTNQTKN